MTALLAIPILVAAQLPPALRTCLPALGPAEVRAGLEAVAENGAASAGALRAAVRFLEGPMDRGRYVRASGEIERARREGGAAPALDYALGLLYARGPDIVVGSDSGLVHRRTRNQTNAEIYARRHLLAAARSHAGIADEAAAELARLAFAQSALGGTDSAGVLYLRGLTLARGAGDDVVALFYEDLRPLLSVEEAEAYAAPEPAERVPWMRRYWELSAARWGRTPAARVTSPITCCRRCPSANGCSRFRTSRSP